VTHSDVKETNNYSSLLSSPPTENNTNETSANDEAEKSDVFLMEQTKKDT